MPKLKVSKTDKIFGSYVFDAIEVELIKRRRFVPIPKPFRSLDASTITNGTRISKSFDLSDFTNAFRTRTLLHDATEVTPEVALSNLQRLCFEALDPASEYVGARPIVMSGLANVGAEAALYNPTLTDTTVQGDTIFEAFCRGEGCALQYEFENVRNLQLFALYIRSSCIFDRCVLRYSDQFDEPSLIVTVNDKARRLVYTMHNKEVVGQGILNLDV